MKKRMKMAVAALISAMLVLNTMVITPMTVSAAAVDELDGAAESEITSGADFKYSVYEGKALINEYLGSDENIVIPDVIDGYEVTGLALFKWEPKDNISAVKSVVIPDTVTKIWLRCFQNFTNLETVTFGSHVESIGMCAFFGCSSLKEVELPDSVTDLQGGAFAQCSSLEKVKLPKNLTSIESGTFWNCVSLYDVVLPEKLKVIAGPTDGGAADESLIHGVFDSCSSLYEISLPEGLEEIGAYAFYNSDLNSLSIPSSVKRILDYAFVSWYARTYFLNIFIPPTVEIISDYAFGYYFDSDINEYTKLGYDGTWINRFTVFGCQGTASEVYATENGFDFVAIEESAVNDLRDCGVTYGCVWTLTKDGKMVISSRNEHGGIMGVYWYYCPWHEYRYDVKEVVFEEGVESTGNGTFYWFPNLTKITMADSINKCDSSAFRLTGYYYDESNWEGNILYLGDWAICFRPNQSGIYTIKEGIKHIAMSALVYEESFDHYLRLENIQEIHFPKSFSAISYLDCDNLKSVYLSDSVSVIEDKALGYNYNEKIEGFTIYGYPGTVAETYASENGFTFIPLDEPTEPVYVEKTDEKTGVSATVDEAVELKVDDVTDEASGNIEVFDGEEIFRVYAISLEKDGETVQPSEKVTVKIPCDNENAKVYRVENDNSLTDMNAEYKNGYLIFETDHFSLYLVAVPETVKIGDVNGDGKVTIDDATLVQKAIAELIELDGTQKKAADTNSDGKITIDDATMIQKYIAELIDHLG